MNVFARKVLLKMIKVYVKSYVEKTRLQRTIAASVLLGSWQPSMENVLSVEFTKYWIKVSAFAKMDLRETLKEFVKLYVDKISVLRTMHVFAFKDSNLTTMESAFPSVHTLKYLMDMVVSAKKGTKETSMESVNSYVA